MKINGHNFYTYSFPQKIICIFWVRIKKKKTNIVLFDLSGYSQWNKIRDEFYATLSAKKMIPNIVQIKQNETIKNNVDIYIEP